MSPTANRNRYIPARQRQGVDNPGESPVAQGGSGRAPETDSGNYPYRGEEQFGGGPQYHPDWSNEDPYQQFQQNRTWAADRGNRLDQGYANEQVYRRGLEQGYRGQADTAYSDLYGNPGYTQDEQGNIVRQPQYEAGMTGTDQFNRMNPLDGEFSGMSGNPNSYYGWLDPQSMYDADSASAQQQRNAVNLAEAGTTGAVGRQRTALDSTLNNPELGTSQRYGNSMDAVLNTTHDRLGANYGTTATSLNEAADNPELAMSGEYARKAGMTDAEVEQLKGQAGRDVGLRYQAQSEDLARRAAESGNASPLAIGAAQARLGQQAATQSADARTNADIAARQAQREAATGVERTRQGAEQFRTGAQLQAGTALGEMGQQGAEYEGGLAQSNVQQQENTRQQANQYLAGQRVNAANNVAGNEMQGAEFVGGARLGAEQNIGSTAGGTNRYITSTGTGIAQNVDQANVGRATNLYNIRRGNQQYQNDTRYGQNFDTQGALSRGYQTAANARRADQGEARQYWTGQTNNNAQYGLANSQMRNQNYATQGQLQNTATQGRAQYDLGRRAGSFRQNFMQNTGASMGQMVGNPIRSYGQYQQTRGNG